MSIRLKIAELATGGNVSARGGGPEYSPAYRRLSDVDRRRLDTAFGYEGCGSVDHVNESGLDTFDLSFLGKGAFRRVYAFSPRSDISIENPERYVLKLSRGTGWANEQEVAVYKNISPEIRDQFLVPVADYGTDYYWLMMERADKNPEVLSDDQQAVKEELRDLGWDYGDLKRNNMAFHDGRPKIVDYGYHWRDAESQEYLEV